MTHPSDHVTRQPDQGLGWATPAANAPQTPPGTGLTPIPPVTASRSVPQDAAIAQQRLRAALSEQHDDRHSDDQGRDGPDADQDTRPGDETAARNCDEMVYLRIQWAETTRYEADISVNPYATDAELFTEIAKIPDALRRTLDVAGTDNIITSIVDLDGDRHLSILERAISASNTVGDDVDWGDLADTIDTRLAEAPDWPALSAALDRAAASGYDVAGHLPELAAQSPLPARYPAQELRYRLIADTDAAVSAAPAQGGSAATPSDTHAAVPVPHTETTVRGVGVGR